MAMTPAIDVLLDARALLARPGGWIKGTEVAPREQGGFAYCIQGAITEAEGWTPGYSEAMLRVTDVVGGLSIPSFNDNAETTQGDVLDVMDRAISAEWKGDPIRVRSIFDGMPLPPDLLGEEMLELSEANGSINLIRPCGISEPPFPPAA